MQGALLRSGKLQEFKALGEDGQPVYTSALQLREAIRLKLGREAAHCLAIPQRNETGDRIDWYAPEEGDVVPWSAATDDERLEAKTQLGQMHAKLLGVGKTMRGEQSRERQIFGRLLEKVIYFPDDTHVYLVNGKPVLTFWGFTDPKGASGEDPLGRLKARTPLPAAAAEAAPLAVASAAVTPPPMMPVVAKKRFPWWWLLLIPLLLLLLFWLLHSCQPDLPVPVTSPEVAAPDEAVPLKQAEGLGYNVDGSVVDGSVNSTVTGGITETSQEDVTQEQAAAAAAAAAASSTEPAPAGEDATPPTEEQAKEEQSAAETTPEPTAPESAATEGRAPEQAPSTDSSTKSDNNANAPDASSPQPPPLKMLEIPPDAATSGNTDFLNGKWKAGAGIQDARTGKPMQLDYDFKDGKGKVKVSSGDGVECVGDVAAAMGGGGLGINNQGLARCNDGSTYKLPDVTCKPGGGIAAECTGNYDQKSQFPMSMKQGG